MGRASWWRPLSCPVIFSSLCPKPLQEARLTIRGAFHWTELIERLGPLPGINPAPVRPKAAPLKKYHNYWRPWCAARQPHRRILASHPRLCPADMTIQRQLSRIWLITWECYVILISVRIHSLNHITDK